MAPRPPLPPAERLADAELEKPLVLLTGSSGGDERQSRSAAGAVEARAGCPGPGIAVGVRRWRQRVGTECCLRNVRERWCSRFNTYRLTKDDALRASKIHYYTHMKGPLVSLNI